MLSLLSAVPSFPNFRFVLVGTRVDRTIRQTLFKNNQKSLFNENWGLDIFEIFENSKILEFQGNEALEILQNTQLVWLAW